MSRAQGRRRGDSPLALVSVLLRSVLPLALVWGLTVPALLLLQPEGFFFAHDAVFHLYRTYELDLLLRQGELWPRWQPDFAFGYGYPLFNFYAPLAYYLADGFHHLGLGFVAALKVTAACATLLGATGMFLLGRRWFGAAAGVLAGLAYVYWPYAFVDLYTRWAMPEYLAIALLPWALLAVDALAAADGPAWGMVVVVALAVAVLVLTHNPTALLFLPLVGIYVLAALGDRYRRWDKRTRWQRSLALLARCALALALGLALSAFFWVPAWLDRQYVRVVEDTLFFGALAGLDRLVQVSFFYEYIDPMGKALPVPAIHTGAALLAVPALWRPRAGRWRLFFLLGLCVVLLFAMSDLSAPLWQALPLVTFMSFPWRLQMLLGLAAALLAGAALAMLPGRARWAAVGLLSVVLATSSLANLNPARRDFAEQLVGLPTLARYEASSGYLGTSSPGDLFLPRWVQGDARALARPVERADIGPGRPADVALAAYAPGEVLLQARAAERTTLLWRQFYFPGWSAYVDGEPAALRPEGEEGVLALDLPAGDHDVRLRWEGTPAQRFGEAVSAVGGLVLGALLALGFWQLGRRWRRPAGERRLDIAVAGLPLLASLTFLLLVAALSQAVVARSPTLYPLQRSFGDKVALLGWQTTNGDLGRRSVARLALYWYALQAPAANYVVSLRLVDEEGRVRLRKERASLFFGTAPSSRWHAGELVRDLQEMFLPAGLSPGKYFLDVGLRRADGEALLPLAAADGAQGGESYVRLGPLALVGGKATAYHPANARDDVFGAQLRLAGFDLAGGMPGKALKVQPGQKLDLTLYYEPTDYPQDDYSYFVHLLDAAGRMVAQQDGIAGGGLHPTTLWDPGRPMRERYELTIPRALSPGLYWLTTGLYSGWNMRNLPILDSTGRATSDRSVLTAVKVVGPPPPPPGRATAASFGGVLRLTGYDLQGVGSTDSANRVGEDGRLQVRLHWQAEAETDRDYTVFVHLVDAQGKVWAQRDSQPRGNTYPTSQWERGEVVVDEVELHVGPEVPPGAYRVKVGWYLLATGERLDLAGGGDSQFALEQSVVVGGR